MVENRVWEDSSSMSKMVFTFLLTCLCLGLRHVKVGPEKEYRQPKWKTSKERLVFGLTLASLFRVSQNINRAPHRSPCLKALFEQAQGENIPPAVLCKLMYTWGPDRKMVTGSGWDISTQVCILRQDWQRCRAWILSQLDCQPIWACHCTSHAAWGVDFSIARQEGLTSILLHSQLLPRLPSGQTQYRPGGIW